MYRVQSTLFALLIASGAVFADTTLNLTPGVSPISHDVYELHMTVLWICVVIGVLVFGAMFYSIIFHRKSLGAVPANFHTHPLLEITWTIIPALILVVMAIPATKVLMNMNNYDQEELTIKITGYQWKWHYEYIEDGVSFFSNLSTPFNQLHNEAPKGEYYLREVDKPLVVPIHKKIRFLITSNDVNHAWWVPDFGVKRDAIAGFINEAWTIVNKPGTYRGQCAELCGINHAFMPIVVVATSEADYKLWVAKQKGLVGSDAAEINRDWTQKELYENGEKVYTRICAACHQPSGMGQPPTFPALKGSKITTGPIANHINTVFNGVSGTAMQAFKNQLTDVELASIITYERNAWGNNTNTFVQPIQIKAYRDGKTIDEALKMEPSGPAPTPAGEAASKTAPLAAKEIAPPAQPQKVETKAPTVSPVTTLPPPNQQAIPKATDLASGAPPASQATSAESLKVAMEKGEKVYLTTCAVCHQPAGGGMPPTFPALKQSPIVMGAVAAHIDRVMNGKPGTAMQAFKAQLNDEEIANVITYERNAWGNNTGTLVTPEQIKAARK